MQIDENLREVNARYSGALSALGHEADVAEQEEPAEVVGLTLDEVLAIHADQVKKYGGAEGVVNQDLLDSSVAMPFQSVFGMDVCPTVYAKAAKYLETFAHYQIFCDGNKRTGVATAMSFLSKNGIECELTEPQVYHLAMGVAVGKYDAEFVERALELSAACAVEKPREQSPAPSRVYLSVPYVEKDEAKALGAKWDFYKKRWYYKPAEVADSEAFAQWASKSNREEIDNEVRSLGLEPEER